ncbi:membrane bound O-acyl transferase family-domain-containing protein [Crassisporium funariophilum]|nr:membrane bound O-acyl transferase family-domain-containing protein [Crassisporium funariophilum]
MIKFSELLDHRRPLDLQNFTYELLPPLLCYYATAILVLIPRTLYIRLALLPVTLYAAFRASTQLDLAAGYGHDERLAYLNQGLLLAMTTLCLRATIWSFQLKPYERHASPHKPNPVPTTGPQRLLDALDLMFNLRGLGWTWSRGLKIPSEHRPSSPPLFILVTFLSLVAHSCLFDIAHRVVQASNPLTIGSPAGGSIYDMTLPPHQRYLRSSCITFFAGLTIYNAIQGVYLLVTLVSILLFRSEPSQWPPIFDEPWFSTSLTQFWSRRWHQLFRDNFVSFGGRPLAWLIGRVGGVLGAFLVSGILHDLGLWGMGRGSDFQRVGGYFLLNGVGIILEHSWKKATGYRIDGFLGRVWTFVWVVGLGNMLVEAWSTRGLVGSAFFPDGYRPTDFILGWWFKT